MLSNYNEYFNMIDSVDITASKNDLNNDQNNIQVKQEIKEENDTEMKDKIKQEIKEENTQPIPLENVFEATNMIFKDIITESY